MKKIKLLSLFLAVLMLAGMATLFSSCAGTEPGVITPSEETVDIDFTGYTALYGETQGTSNITRTVRSRFESFAENLSAVTGVNVKIMQCGRKAPEEGAKEILIGLTDREESKAALEEIVGDGFVIQVLEDKIVIIGTSNLYTAMAVDYFEKTYVTGKEKSKTLTVNESVLACEMTSVTLTNSSYKNDDVETKAYTYVYKNGLGMVPNAYSSLATDVSQPNFNELPMTVATKLTESMAGISRLAQKFYPVGNDATVKEKEVLIGITNRDESKAALAQIDETQYIITVIGERVVLTAWSNMILNQAVEAYTDIMKEATMKDAEGNTVVCLPRDFRLIGNGDHDWVTDFPKPEGEGIALNSTMDNNDNSLQYIYTGTGVTEAAYNAYVAQLKTAGYKEVQSTSAEGSIFKFFKNTAKEDRKSTRLNSSHSVSSRMPSSA